MSEINALKIKTESNLDPNPRLHMILPPLAPYRVGQGPCSAERQIRGVEGLNAELKVKSG